MEYNQLEHSSIRLYTHEAGQCIGEVCTIHHRTNHNMRKFSQFYRFDRGIMERMCSHSVGHPDPDDIRIVSGEDDGTHGCDGCCLEFEPDDKEVEGILNGN